MKINRPIAELDADGLAAELAADAGAPVAVSLLARDDGGTDVIVHSRIPGSPAPQMTQGAVERAVARHKPTPPPAPSPALMQHPVLPPVTQGAFPSFVTPGRP